MNSSGVYTNIGKYVDYMDYMDFIDCVFHIVLNHNQIVIFFVFFQSVQVFVVHTGGCTGVGCFCVDKSFFLVVGNGTASRCGVCQDIVIATLAEVFTSTLVLFWVG